MKFKTGYCQFQPEFLKRDENIDKMRETVKNIDADLIVFPELATSGYCFESKEQVKKISENVSDSPTFHKFSQLASENNTGYVIGFVEEEDGYFYNSAMLVNPDQTFYVYRKTHLFYNEKKFFSPGTTGLHVYPTKNNVRVGMMICFDWIFPEAARTLSLKGAQILAHPANLVLPWCQEAMKIRSLENRVFSVTANRIGKEKYFDEELIFTGMSQITNTTGEIIKRAEEKSEEVFVTEIEIDEANNKSVTSENDIFSDRREEFYF
ncbi:MAG: beta-ureidopropionase [Candidatus Cloacimonadota bacterium]|nr:MAG: beta-ureidopropionase [Candidatus Cloacimonadota bacterium]